MSPPYKKAEETGYEAHVFSAFPMFSLFFIDRVWQACYNVLGSSEPRRCHKTVDGSAFPCLQGVQMLFHPLPCNGKGVTEMTTSELYEFCLVLISLAELIILIIQLNKKK